MSDAPTASFEVDQPCFRGTLGELAHALRSGSIGPAQLDLLALVHAFLEHFESLSQHDLDLASEALPRVAGVIELKLRLLLPRPPRESEDEEEGGLEETLAAVATLEELEEAIDFLRRRREDRRVVLPAHTPRPHYPRPERPLSIGVDRLALLASRYRAAGYFELSVERLSMASAMQRIALAVRRWRRLLLHEVSEERDWGTLTVLFAGMLELVREGRLRARQERPYGEIALEAAEEQAEVA